MLRGNCSIEMEIELPIGYIEVSHKARWIGCIEKTGVQAFRLSGSFALLQQSQGFWSNGLSRFYLRYFDVPSTIVAPQGKICYGLV